MPKKQISSKPKTVELIDKVSQSLVAELDNLNASVINGRSQYSERLLQAIKQGEVVAISEHAKHLVARDGGNSGVGIKTLRASLAMLAKRKDYGNLPQLTVKLGEDGKMHAAKKDSAPKGANTTPKAASNKDAKPGEVITLQDVYGALVTLLKGCDRDTIESVAADLDKIVEHALSEIE